MSGGSTTWTALLRPPAEAPLLASGAHTPAWTDYHDKVALALGAVRTGVTDGSDAAAGQIGEYLTAAGGPVGLSSGVVNALASLPLTAGDWDVQGNVGISTASTTHLNEIVTGVNTSPTAFGAVYTQIGTSFNVGGAMQMSTGGSVRVSTATPVTAYLLVRATFTTSTLTASGTVWARRVR